MATQQPLIDLIPKEDWQNCQNVPLHSCFSFLFKISTTKRRGGTTTISPPETQPLILYSFFSAKKVIEALCIDLLHCKIDPLGPLVNFAFVSSLTWFILNTQYRSKIRIGKNVKMSHFTAFSPPFKILHPVAPVQFQKALCYDFAHL